MRSPLPRRLAAILYADVAGYSRLTEENEDATHRALSDYLDVLSTTVKEHGGQVVHYAGDAVLAKFDAVVDALSSAVAIQNEINILNRELPDERKVQFRIGVNLGDVIEDRGDIYGDGVNVAARLESLADPGGICVSESVRLALGSKLPPDFESMGEQVVKNIVEPVVVYRTAPRGNSAKGEHQTLQKPAELPDRPSIAVLPFTNMSGDEEQQYFSDGITEDIIAGLSRFKQLLVIARGSAFQFKSPSMDVAEAANKLGVRYVLEGSVRKAGERVRVTAQLVEGATGHQLWADSYDRVLKDVFALQDDVTERIISTLAGRLEDADRARTSRQRTGDLSAYDYYLRGKYCGEWNRSKDDVFRAREMLDKAVGLDPKYAAAYAWLATTYLEEYVSSWTKERTMAGERAFEYARMAVALDNCDSSAHLVLANSYFVVKSNFDLAEAQFRTAMQLNPNDYWNYCARSIFSTCAGDLEDGISCGYDAIRRNPMVPEPCLYNIGFAEYLSGHYEQAITTFGKLSSHGPEVQACLAASYAQLGFHDQASAAVAEFRRHVGEGSAKEFPRDPGSWREFWSRFLPVKDPGMLESLIEGLRKAGLAE